VETQLQNQNKMSTFVIKCCVYLYFSSSKIAKSIKNLKFNNMAIKLKYYCVLKEAKWVIKWRTALCESRILFLARTFLNYLRIG
jgi:hypothetical protein